MDKAASGRLVELFEGLTREVVAMQAAMSDTPTSVQLEAAPFCPCQDTQLLILAELRAIHLTITGHGEAPVLVAVTELP